MNVDPMKNEFDVVVVGHGIAGLCAAVAAMEGGAKVAVLERAPQDESGGCTRYTEAFLRMKSEDAVSDDFEAQLADCASGNLDQNIVRALDAAPDQWSAIVRTAPVHDPEFLATFAREAVPAVHWLRDMGVRFIPAVTPQLSTRGETALIAPSGGGMAMMDALMAKAQAGGVAFFYETAARKLLEDASGSIVGVSAMSKGNRRVDFSARAVVLASGGFEGSAEMLARYVGLGSTNIRPVALGCHFNRGDGIRMALDVGATPSGDYNAYHATPVDERSGRFEAKILIFPYGIVLNKQGTRFIDEASTATYDNYDRLCYGIQAQRDGTAYVVVDSKIQDVPDWKKLVYTDKQPIEASTLEELARRIDVPVETLVNTVNGFNAGCGQGEFDPRKGDHLSTTGVLPPKSHWARPIDQGPFYCYPVVPSGIITYGGIKTDAGAHVLNTEGDRIPGLFAAGAMVGIYYRKYVGGTSVMRGATFGRIAGIAAAAKIHAGL
ncbi:FAD-dependent oxidoreductase [Hydrogenophaga sp. BPS33]|uniref:FAD-dependent oxidoreductase n=1 Tax=Hydrogenophaga sp. BPS33 TaxID=2651974 RepID=UPI001320563D|nr:FAD-dependent oxidoreductase [Hydrogenophaga sp. BPS33]QHE87480.1 FAD-dependent oxidoreductase [Hydrogenophaga sp. BPS33]